MLKGNKGKEEILIAIYDAKSYNHTQGIDYHDNFAPVVLDNLKVHQIHVKKGYLHAAIEDKIYLDSQENATKGHKQ